VPDEVTLESREPITCEYETMEPLPYDPLPIPGPVPRELVICVVLR